MCNFTYCKIPFKIENGISLSDTAGWGVYDTTDFELNTSFELLTVNISVIPFNLCNGPHSYNGLLPENVFCANQIDAAPGICHVNKTNSLTCDFCP